MTEGVQGMGVTHRTVGPAATHVPAAAGGGGQRVALPLTVHAHGWVGGGGRGLVRHVHVGGGDDDVDGGALGQAEQVVLAELRAGGAQAKPERL
jgi:hypothetical protein